MAMSIVQGGSGFPFLAPAVYEYLVSGKCTGITLQNSDVPDHTLQFVLSKVSFSIINSASQNFNGLIQWNLRERHKFSSIMCTLHLGPAFNWH